MFRIDLGRNFEQEFQRNVILELRKIIQKNIPSINRNLKETVKQLVYRRLVSNVPLITGREYHEIGVPDINDRILGILRVVADNISVKVLPDKNLFRITIDILKEEYYEELLNLPEAVFTYRNGRLEWLRWLLLEGTNPILDGYYYLDRNSINSRTGRGLTVRSYQSWSVPPNIAGIPENNFITRALQNILKDIELSIEQDIKRLIK